ncbi:Spore germination protein [Fictibacillus solisalsi]|uniref:Spore germination protein n=1 Tax=Fictibacillus solisalsi TaxID=459525 RepID=A0A1G9WLN7_9BACL|nr:GerAB/ArcD/ProY family transporter [Fictibacillus solisalsi]SDM85066.1 Spore germination protein [Fictibacillus solisalsi]
MTHRIQVGMLFIIMHLSFSYLIYPDLIYRLTKTSHWEVILCQGLMQLILLWIYYKGLNYFPDKNVIEIYLKIGKWAAIIFLTPYVINLIAIVGFNLRLHAEVINDVFLPRTPYWSILILLFFISVYTAIKGLDTILRSSVIIFFIVIPLIFFNIFSSFTNFDLHSVSPVWDSPLKFLFNIKYFYLMGFSSFLILGFISSGANSNFCQIFAVFVSVVLFSLSAVYIPLFIFGQETVTTLAYPFLEAINSVDISWFIFNRQTMVFGISLVGLVILANAVLLWMSGHIMQKTYKWKTMEAAYWIILLSVIAFVVALVVPHQSLVEKFFLWSTGAQTYFMIIIPSFIFLYGSLSKGGLVGYDKK